MANRSRSGRGLGGSCRHRSPRAQPGFVTGLELDTVSAGRATFIPGRGLDDNAHVLMRFAGGAHGTLTASQIAVGNLNNLSIKVYGSRGGLEWAGEDPETLRFTPYGEPSRILRRGGPGN